MLESEKFIYIPYFKTDQLQVYPFYQIRHVLTFWRSGLRNKHETLYLCLIKSRPYLLLLVNTFRNADTLGPRKLFPAYCRLKHCKDVTTGIYFKGELAKHGPALISAVVSVGQ